MRAGATDELTQQWLIAAGRLSAGGLITSLLSHTVPAWASSLLLHRPLCLSLSLTTLPHYNPLYLCVCVCMLCASRDMGVGGRGGRFHCYTENNAPFDASQLPLFR